MGPIIQLAPSSARMRVVILLSLLAGAIAAPESRFLCSECVDEMRKLGHMVKMGAVVIHDYIRDNYCPTLGDHQHFCENPFPDTTLACCTPLWSTTLWMEPSTFARQAESVRRSRSTLATNASRAWNGSRRTLRIRS